VRYYNIKISEPSSGAVIREFKSTQPNGLADPGALNVELDIPVTQFGTPYSNNDAGCYVRIWGIPLQEIGQATNYGMPNKDTPGKNILVRGGMQKGLPLAIPSQQGILVQGQIFQAFGNWIGTTMTLDLIIMPVFGGSATLKERAKNLSFIWIAGTPIDQAIRTTLNTALPNFKLNMDVQESITRANDEKSVHYTLSEFARAIAELAPTVAISVQGNTLTVTDNKSVKKPKEIKFTDLVGQPTWVSPASIQATTIMRADIDVFDQIKLPPTAATLIPQSFASLRSSTAFQGIFTVSKLRHRGNFRQPDGESWVTDIDAVIPNA
jgi:hypothetical protein